MKRITLLFLFLFTQVLFAQFAASDVKYFIGEGTKTAYLVVDFKDGSDDRSYAWGIHFNEGENLNGIQMLQKIATAESAFAFSHSSGFLDMISFNAHSEQSGDDWWSLWTSSFGPAEFDPSGWMSSNLQNGQWYGASYGFSNPSMEAPANPIAAYSSQWFTNSTITTWYGSGANKSVVVVDFGTETSGVANSFALGIKYDGTLSGEAVLTAVQSYVASFSFTMNADEVATINFASNTQTGNWSIYKGTNLSNWTSKNTLSEVVLSNNDWLGLSFGTRRPFIPQEMNVDLGTPTNSLLSMVKLYPNPVHSTLNIATEQSFKNIEILDQNGRVLITGKETAIDVSILAAGIYIIQFDQGQIIPAKRFIKL